MKQFICCLLLCIISTYITAQSSVGTGHVNEGEMFRENVRILDESKKTSFFKIPNDTCTLLYRFRGNNWFVDNRDSVLKIEAIIEQLRSSSPIFKNIKVVCYSYNKDQFLSSSDKPIFSADLQFVVQYCFIPEKNVSRLLTSEKIILLDKKGKVLSASHYISAFSYTHKSESKRLKAKLLTEKNGIKIPLINATVFLFSKSARDSVTFTKTNKYGDFELNVPQDADENVLRVEPFQKGVKTVILATQEGEEKARLQKAVVMFEYKLIDAEINRLSDIYTDEEMSQSFEHFVKSNDKEFVKAEHLKYDVGSFSVEKDAKKVLDKVAQMLLENPSINLEVISHTDSQGEDKTNLQLSEKRSLNVVSYLILLGVESNRLSFKGKGESQIRNRCINDVECSDMEHGYNRRTEFRFFKN